MRKNKRITQEELAELLDVTPTHVKHIESGHRKPSIEILLDLAKILNFSLDSMVDPYIKWNGWNVAGVRFAGSGGDVRKEAKYNT